MAPGSSKLLKPRRIFKNGDEIHIKEIDGNKKNVGNICGWTFYTLSLPEQGDVRTKLGMFQRIEKLRKHAFGSMLVIKSGGKIGIKGLWFWRTQDLVFKLSPDWCVDYESYSWKKLDPASDETKDLVTKYFLQEGDFGGDILDEKIFK